MRGASDRFFLAAVLGGRLHPDGIPEWGSWDSSRLHWWSGGGTCLLIQTPNMMWSGWLKN